MKPTTKTKKPKLKTFTYRSNNSGGYWWLKDKDWKALEKNGWKVNWFKNQADRGFCRPDAKGRWLGALATSASKSFYSEKEAIAEWERITGQDASDGGCPCCGAPHYFSEGRD